MDIERKPCPQVDQVERLGDGVAVTFDDGTLVSFSSAELWQMRADGSQLSKFDQGRTQDLRAGDAPLFEMPALFWFY